MLTKIDNQIANKVQIPKGKGSFISKLIQILKLYPEVIHWTEDGTKIKVSDISRMEKQIIPAYYRHSNINSFVRQLNMYYFSKLETDARNQMIFENKKFTRGNEESFHLIQRRNRERDEIVDKIHHQFATSIEKINRNKDITEQGKEMLVTSIQYQQIILKNLQKIKTNMSKLQAKLKNSRGKEVKEILVRLRTTYIEQINETIKNGRKINELVKESHQWFENQIKNPEEEEHWEPDQNPPEINNQPLIVPISSMGIMKNLPANNSKNSFDERLPDEKDEENEGYEDQISFGIKLKENEQQIDKLRVFE